MVKADDYVDVSATPLTDDEREELQELRAEMELSSLGDRPHSIAAHKLARLIELEAREVNHADL